MWYFKVLNLPPVPEHFTDDILAHGPTDILRDYPGWTHVREDGTIVVSARNPICTASPELEAWLRDNITAVYRDVGIRYAFGSANPGTAGVHTDQTRKYVLQYLVRDGGATLTYWQEEGYPVMREPHARVGDYNKLKVLDSGRLEEGRWAILDTRILHSVENLTGDRISVQISLDDIPDHLNLDNKN
jgi:hypothetical protein